MFDTGLEVLVEAFYHLSDMVSYKVTKLKNVSLCTAL